MRLTIRFPVVLLALVVTASACGGGGAGEGGEAVAGTTNTSGSPSTTVSAPPGESPTQDQRTPGTAPGAGSPQDGAGASGADDPSPSQPAAPGQMQTDAELAEDCVQAGGVQSLTVTTRAESAVAYGSTYSDGATSFDDDYYGGSDSGFADESGRYADRWTVGADAPSGQVVVDVQAVAPDGSAVGTAQVSFEVVGLGELCP